MVIEAANIDKIRCQNSEKNQFFKSMLYMLLNQLWKYQIHLHLKTKINDTKTIYLLPG